MFVDECRVFVQLGAGGGRVVFTQIRYSDVVCG